LRDISTRHLCTFLKFEICSFASNVLVVQPFYTHTHTHTNTHTHTHTVDSEMVLFRQSKHENILTCYVVSFFTFGSTQFQISSRKLATLYLGSCGLTTLLPPSARIPREFVLLPLLSTSFPNHYLLIFLYCTLFSTRY
jgi:hypothetical protein